MPFTPSTRVWPVTFLEVAVMSVQGNPTVCMYIQNILGDKVWISFEDTSQVLQIADALRNASTNLTSFDTPSAN